MTNPPNMQAYYNKPQIYKQDRIDFKRLNDLLKPYIYSLSRRILPNGRLEGHEYVALNPTRNDKHLGSFRINIRTGKWSDFATRYKGGDFISLWSYVYGIKQIEAAIELQIIIGDV